MGYIEMKHPSPIVCKLGNAHVRIDRVIVPEKPEIVYNFFLSGESGATGVGAMGQAVELMALAHELLCFIHGWYDSLTDAEAADAMSAMQRLIYGNREGHLQTLCKLCGAPARGLAAGDYPLFHGHAVNAAGARLHIAIVEVPDEAD